MGCGKNLSLAIGLAAALVISPDPGSAQGNCRNVLTSASPPGDYDRIVSLYREGKTSLAVELLGDLRGDRLEPFFTSIQEMTASRPEPCLPTASLLHAETAMRAIEEYEIGLGRAHFEASRALGRLLPRTDEGIRFRRDLLLLSGLFLQYSIFIADPNGFQHAASFYQKGVELFPDDAELLFAAGTLYEWSGSLLFGESSDLRKAEKLYTRALESNPDHARAHLRYGRVLEKQGDYEPAEAELQRALTLATQEESAFRAHMFLGRLAERAGRLDEAVQHYRSAVSLLPSWQVGHLALSHALHVFGSRTEAKAVLEGALDRRPETADELHGWWSYEQGPSPGYRELLEKLQREVRAR